MASMTLDRVDRTSQKSETAVQKGGNSRLKTHSARRIYQIDMGIPRSNEALFFVDERSITPIHVVPIRLEPTGRRSCKRIHLHTDILLRTGLTERPVGPNLCIGTTAPLNKLEVAGTIKSTTGGIVFPDGTVQISAGPYIVIKSSGYAVTTSDNGKAFLVSGTTTLTLPAAASAGAGFSIRVKNTGTSYVTLTPNGAENIDAANSSFYLYLQNTSLTLVSDGTGWQVLDVYGQTGRIAPTSCDDGSTRCYTNSTALTNGVAITGTGKLLKTYDLPDGTKAWVEMGGSRVLSINYSDDWLKKLPVGGKNVLSGSSPYYPTGSAYTNAADLGGYRCPPNVYVNDSDKVRASYCLFYDKGASYMYLFAYGTSQTTLGQIGLATWSTAYWYQGNFDVCAQKGMRLPTLYETTASDPGGSYKPTDASPTFASITTGVPSWGSNTWTASSYTSDTSNYWLWNGTGTSGDYWGSYYNIRCVLP